MVARTLWLWLSLGWLTEAVVNPSTTSICDLGPCRCTRGKVVCHCTTSTVKMINLTVESLDNSVFSSISVTNCSHVHMASRALSGLPALQQVSVANIARLSLEEQAFSWSTDNPQHSGLLVNISDSVVPEIPSYCFRGSLRDIFFDNVNISRIQAYAFSSIDYADSIELKRINVVEVESQSFKMFSVNFLIISDSSFNVLPSRTMVDVEVHQEVKFENLKADTIKYSGFKIHGPREFLMARSVIRHLEHQAFHVHTRGPVYILDNEFLQVEEAAFAGFTTERRFMENFSKVDLVFENNTLTHFESASLVFNTTGFSPKLDKIVINQNCSCDNVRYWASDLAYFSSTPISEASSIMFCSNGEVARSIGDFQKLFCDVEDLVVAPTFALTCCSIFSLSFLLTIVYCRTKERAKRYINVPNSPSPVKRPHGNRILVIPDGKIYRETELHVIVEHADPITPTEYMRNFESSELKT